MASFIKYIMVTGVEELNRKLMNMSRGGQNRAMRYAFKAPCQMLVKELKSACPVVTGTLKKSIAWRMLGVKDAKKGRNVGRGPNGEEVSYFAKAGPDVGRKKVNPHVYASGSAKFRAPHTHFVTLGTHWRTRLVPDISTVTPTRPTVRGLKGVRGKYWKVEWIALQRGDFYFRHRQKRGTGAANPNYFVDKTEQRKKLVVQNMIEIRFEQAIEKEWKKENP